MRLSRPDSEAVDKIVSLWLKQGRIRPSTSQFAARCFLVPKADGSSRLVVDFSPINSHFQRDLQPPPDAQSIFDGFSGCQIFSALDFQSAYLQIPVHEDSRHFLSFSTDRGQFEFCYVPFGLAIAGSKLQRELDSVLGRVPGCNGSIDDWILHHNDSSAHIHALGLAFDKIRESGFLLKPSKCSFLYSEVPFLGRIVSATGQRPDPADVADLLSMPAPSSQKLLQRFLGSDQWLAPFVKDFQSVAAPLRHLLYKSATWSWGPDEDAAFTAIKRLMADPGILAFPDFSKRFTLEVDASEVGFGAVLSQHTVLNRFRFSGDPSR
jgi:hypothetical protein